LQKAKTEYANAQWRRTANSTQVLMVRAPFKASAESGILRALRGRNGGA
jgi:hypothetical protein